MQTLGTTQTYPSIGLHHLPNRGQNIFYLCFLVFSPILSLAVNTLLFEDFRADGPKKTHHFHALNWLFEASGLLLASVLFLLAINIAMLLLRHRRRIRHSLLLFGIVSTLYLLINLAAASYGIFAYKIQSAFLLAVSFGTYLSVNMVFLFWYWYVDYPGQVRHLHHPGSPLEIAFPVGSPIAAPLVPGFVDYLYLTIMVSNTLGPPENHSTFGVRAKLLQVVHSVIMLVLLVIFVSRAINTLS